MNRTGKETALRGRESEGEGRIRRGESRHEVVMKGMRKRRSAP